MIYTNVMRNPMSNQNELCELSSKLSSLYVFWLIFVLKSFEISKDAMSRSAYAEMTRSSPG